jgi:hypothetical protein
MQTTAPDREIVQPEPVSPDSSSSDSASRDAFELWQDLGGSD